jgi:hypothetical protein
VTLRVEFKMLFGKPVPADLNWGVIGEWGAGIDYQTVAHRIYDSLFNHYPLKSVCIFKDDEQIACWSHFEDVTARYREQENIQKTFDQALARYRER